MAKKKDEQQEMQPLVVERGRVRFAVLGETALVFNRQTEKVKQGLLLPKGRMTQAEKQGHLKHDVYGEFFDSPYTLEDPTAPTLLCVKSSAFKGAIASAAIDMPGMQKAQIGRLVYVPGDMVPVYGIPELKMDTVIQAGISHAPDVRTRAAVKQWACFVDVLFICPLITDTAVAHLLAAGGMFIGIGDGRPQKGKLNHGQFTCVEPSDPRFVAVLKGGGRAAQEAAMKSPKPYDRESADLWAWFRDEVVRRGRSKQVTIQG